MGIINRVDRSSLEGYFVAVGIFLLWGFAILGAGKLFEVGSAAFFIATLIFTVIIVVLISKIPSEKS